MKPIARTDRLIKQVVDQETLVYDAADDTACCLNFFATLVWRHCDGVHTVDEIAAFVSAEMAFPDGVDPADAVWRALDELEAHHLVSMPAEDDAEDVAVGMRRRELVKALAMLPLFPAILQVTAPIHTQTTSPAPSSTPPAASSSATPPAPSSSSPAPTATSTHPAPTSTPPAPTATSTPPVPSATPTHTPTPTPSPTPTV